MNKDVYSAKSPCENIGIMGALEGALKLVQLVAGERGSVSSLLWPLDRISDVLSCCWSWAAAGHADVIVQFDVNAAALTRQYTDSP